MFKICLLPLLSLCAALAPLEGGRVMTLGKIGAMKMMLDWHNPYVTDGLIAMWDGEWNAGGGVHDPNATTWVDLCGNGYNFTIPASGAVWGNDKISLTATSLSVELTQANRTEFTIECVSESTGNSGAMVWFKEPSAVFGSILRWNGNYGSCYYPWNSVGNINENSLLSASLSWENNNQVLYKNAVEWATKQTALSHTNLSTVVIGEYNGSKLATANCHVLRMYSRVLTAAEVAANYAVDKKRFNLP